MKPIRVDFHILQHPTERRDCSEVYEKLRQEHNVFIIPGYVDHIGRGRAEGFAQGHSDYVSFVDDDDIVYPEHVSKMLDLMDAVNADGVCSLEETHGGVRKYHDHPKQGEKFCGQAVLMIHHLLILRRSYVTRYLNLLQRCPDFAEYTMLAQGELEGKAIVSYDSVAYTWNAQKRPKKQMLPFQKELFSRLAQV